MSVLLNPYLFKKISAHNDIFFLFIILQLNIFFTARWRFHERRPTAEQASPADVDACVCVCARQCPR